MSKKLDVIIFGASGYTGQRVLKEFLRIISEENVEITWGIAGRSLEKLRNVLKGISVKTDNIILADTRNEESLLKMASQARLLFNCTGPYKFHGEPVVQACIQEKCHYIDVNAEPQFMEKMQLRYNKKAEENGVYIVPACGIDCIPTDMGLDFLKKNFDGTLNSVEVYQELFTKDNFGVGCALHKTTWESFLYVLREIGELKKIRTELFKKDLRQLEPKLHLRRLPHRIPISRNYAGPYPGGEATVMRRSERYFYENFQSRPVQIHTYLGSSNFFHYIILFIGFFVLRLLILSNFLFNLVLKNPRIFTFGFIGNEPDIEDTMKIKSVLTFYGRGWKGKVVDENYKQIENSWIIGRVEGIDGYKITGICAAASALILLENLDKFPKRGGVFTTASLFSDTDLIRLLQKNGLKFEICGKGNL